MVSTRKKNVLPAHPGVKVKPVSRGKVSRPKSMQPLEFSFSEIVRLIRNAKQKAFYAVNTALIDLHWQVGEYISRKVETEEWGKSVVQKLSTHIQLSEPGIRGFSSQNLWRMSQFFDAYRVKPKLSPLVRELPWTHNLIILTQSKRPEEQEFYLRMAIQERWGKRELERQFRRALFERTILHPPKLSPAVRQIHGDAVGFEPEYLGKMAFYLEALDRDHRKSHENPAMGVLLCASKDSEVVEYALNRTLSPALVAEYQTGLPKKALLQRKLAEFYELETNKSPNGFN